MTHSGVPFPAICGVTNAEQTWSIKEVPSLQMPYEVENMFMKTEMKDLQDD